MLNQNQVVFNFKEIPKLIINLFFLNFIDASDNRTKYSGTANPAQLRFADQRNSVIESLLLNPRLKALLIL